MTLAEDFGVRSRGAFYETAGCLRDAILANEASMGVFQKAARRGDTYYSITWSPGRKREEES